MEINKLYNEDCMITLKSMDDNSVDLIIADPPYYKIVKEDWDNNWKDEKEYINWCLAWTEECYRVLKEGGQLCVWGAIGKNKEHPFLKYLFYVERDTKFTFVNWITMRNFRCFGNSKHFPFARQECLIFSKGQHKTYNKQYSDFEGTNRLGDPKLINNVWTDCKDVALFNKKDSHPTEKPELAEERIVLSLSNENDLVYIPFAGSDSDISPCIAHNRKWIASEKSKQYCDVIENRLTEKTKLN